MIRAKQILVFGRDMKLLETRLLILEGAGLRCHAVSSVADLIHFVCVNEVDIVMLSQCLSLDDVQAVLDIVASVNPDTLILRLSSFYSDIPIKNEVLLDAGESPHRILKELENFLGNAEA